MHPSSRISVASVLVRNGNYNRHSAESPIVVCEYIEGVRSQVYDDIGVRLKGMERLTV